MFCMLTAHQISRGNYQESKARMVELNVTNCTRINGTTCDESCFLKPVGYHSTVLPWLYLLLTILGILTNGLATLDLWRTEKTPTVIFTLNIMVSDLMLCCSFPFRMAYYIRGSQWKADTAVCSITEFLMVSCFYINLYCNVSFLLWTSINRCVTVVRLRCRLFLVFKHPRLCWLLCLSTWIGGSSLVIGSMRYKAAIKSTGQKVESCFDQVINKNPSELNRVHCLAVGVFFFMLGLMLLSYGLLILHLHKVNQMSLRIKMIAHGDKDCTTKTVQQRSSDFCLKTLLILVAALSCCLHPVLYLVLQMPCCRAKRNTRNRPKPENYMCAPQIQTINST